MASFKTSRGRVWSCFKCGEPNYGNDAYHRDKPHHCKSCGVYQPATDIGGSSGSGGGGRQQVDDENFFDDPVPFDGGEVEFDPHFASAGRGSNALDAGLDALGMFADSIAGADASASTSRADRRKQEKAKAKSAAKAAKSASLNAERERSRRQEREWASCGGGTGNASSSSSAASSSRRPAATTSNGSSFSRPQPPRNRHRRSKHRKNNPRNSKPSLNMGADDDFDYYDDNFDDFDDDYAYESKSAQPAPASSSTLNLSLFSGTRPAEVRRRQQMQQGSGSQSARSTITAAKGKNTRAGGARKTPQSRQNLRTGARRGSDGGLGMSSTSSSSTQRNAKSNLPADEEKVHPLEAHAPWTQCAEYPHSDGEIDAAASRGGGGAGAGKPPAKRRKNGPRRSAVISDHLDIADVGRLPPSRNTEALRVTAKQREYQAFVSEEEALRLALEASLADFGPSTSDSGVVAASAASSSSSVDGNAEQKYAPAHTEPSTYRRRVDDIEEETSIDGVGAVATSRRDDDDGYSGDSEDNEGGRKSRTKNSLNKYDKGAPPPSSHTRSGKGAPPGLKRRGSPPPGLGPRLNSTTCDTASQSSSVSGTSSTSARKKRLGDWSAKSAKINGFRSTDTDFPSLSSKSASKRNGKAPPANSTPDIPPLRLGAAPKGKAAAAGNGNMRSRRKIFAAPNRRNSWGETDVLSARYINNQEEDDIQRAINLSMGITSDALPASSSSLSKSPLSASTNGAGARKKNSNGVGRSHNSNGAAGGTKRKKKRRAPSDDESNTSSASASMNGGGRGKGPSSSASLNGGGISSAAHSLADSSYVAMSECPVCAESFRASMIQRHVNECLERQMVAF